MRAERLHFRLPAAMVVALFAGWTLPHVVRGQDGDEWAKLIGKAEEAEDHDDQATAIQLCKQAIKVKPEEHHGWAMLARLYQELDLIDEALEAEDKNLEVFKAGKSTAFVTQQDLAAIYSRRAQLNMNLGETAKAKEQIAEGIKLDPKSSGLTAVLAHVLANAGELDKALEAMDRASEFLKANPASGNDPRAIAYERGVMRRMKGDDRGARADFERLIADEGKVPPVDAKISATGHAGMALLHALSSDPKVRDLKKARESLDVALHDPSWPMVGEANAIVTLVEGDASAAIPLFASAKQAWTMEVRFYHGLAQLRAGSRDRAVELLVIAADVNPAYRKRVEEDPEFAPVRAAVLATLKELGKKPSADRLGVKRELASNPVQFAYIEGLAKARRFTAAIEAYEAFAKQAKSDAVRDGVAERIKALRAYAALHDRLVKAIGKGRFKDAKLNVRGDANVTLGTADNDTVELAMNGGTVKGPWTIVPFEVYASLLSDISASEDDWFTVGLLCFEGDRVAQGESLFLKCLAKGKAFQGKIDLVVATRRGVAVPQGGFVPNAGRLVTATEREKLSKGLVQFRGEWVTKEDKQHLEKGHEKSGGKWVELTAAQLQARGFVKFGDEWKTKEEVARLRGEWTDAWTLETGHYEIRTNKSEVCLQALGVALEDAYKSYEKFFGKAPPTDKKMKVLAFAKFDDYSAYCHKVGHEKELNATGFAPSEPWTLCGYDKFGDQTELVRTILHEGCHLFYQLAFPEAHAPSWLAEGMATNFEGFTLEEGHPKFNFLSRDRTVAFKEAARRRLLPSIGDFFGGDAGALIARDPRAALTFYAEAWGFFYFMTHTLDERYRKGFAAFMTKMNQGEKADLKEELGPAFDSLEQDFVEFVRGL